jgi:hypothetical protein
LGEDALEHEIAVFGWGGGEEGPDVGDGLLVGLRDGTEFLLIGQHTVSHWQREGSVWYILELFHRGLVGLTPTLEIGTVTVAELCA